MLGSTSRRILSLSHQFLYSSSTSSDNVDFVEGSLPKVILNKPKVLNSLNIDMIKSIATLLPRLENAPAFWIQGAGGKAFCAGGDVKTLFEGEDANYQKRQNFFRTEFTLDYQLSSLKSLQIANWDGIVMGGGVGVSIFSPYRIATESTMLAMPEAKIGFYTDVGSAYVLNRLRNNIGLYIAMTSGRLKGEDVYNSGFANYFVAKDSVGKIYQELNSTIKGSTNPKQTIEGVLNKYHIGPNSKKIVNEDQICHIFGGQSVKEIYQRAVNSKTKFGDSVVKSLQDVCPLSVHIIFRLIKDSVGMSIREVFIRDFTLAQFFSANKNFETGVRSLLIEKSNNPQWTHKHLLDIKDQEVDEAFKGIQGKLGLKI